MVAKKEDWERVRRNKPGYVNPNQQRKQSEPLPEWDGEVRGPELDPNINWPEATKSWWHTWRCSSQAMVCTDTDWESMKVAALIHKRIAEGVSDTALANLTGELRKREGMFGGSFEDRQRLGMSIKNTAQEEKLEEAKINQEVARTINYFEMLTKRTGGG